MVKTGYMGLATIDGKKVRCTDFNVNPAQDVLFYDPIFGLRDSKPKIIYEGKSDIGAANEQRFLWRPSVKSYVGSINYPICSYDPLLSLAQTGDDFEITFDYFCDIKRKFKFCKVNTYTISVAAGDIATVSANIMALECEDIISSGGYEYTRHLKMEKPLTWDDISLSVSNVSSFSLTINNSCKPIYTAKGLSPLSLRVGVQMVNGVVSYYGENSSFSYVGDVRDLKFKSSVVNFDYNVVYRPSELTGVVGPVVKSVPFVAVDINDD